MLAPVANAEQANDYLYIGYETADGGSIAAVDLRTPNQAVRTWDTAAPVRGLTVKPGGRNVYSAEHDVVAYDAFEGTEVARTPAGDAQEIAFTPDGNDAWVAESEKPGGVVHIDVRTDEAVGYLQGTDAPKDIVITPDGTTAYVTDFSNSRPKWLGVAVVDLAGGGKVGRIFDHLTYADSDLALSPDGTHLYVTGQQRIQELEPRKEFDQYGRRLDLGVPLRDLAVSQDGATIYVAGASADGTKSALYLVDTATFTVRKQIPLNGRATSVATNGDYVVVSDRSEGGWTYVYEESTNKLRFTGSIPGHTPTALAFAPKR
ncbi:YncE family protein [Actinosynnema sp. NPDC020468]|uniref:YncE family protein n=1 Tax=Actinosynnema sp. NPDC020468 TaxID=3154488 RepID=UPI003401EB93